MPSRSVLGGIVAERISTMRLYGSAIALVSGAYSTYLATTGAGMTGSAWLMLALGLVVLVHGVVLLTPLAASLGAASGPLMIVYAVLMLGNQAWMATMDGAGMGGGMGGMGGMNGMNSMAGGAGWDPGMVAIAVLMLGSGIIMTVRRDMMASGDMRTMD